MADRLINEQFQRMLLYVKKRNLLKKYLVWLKRVKFKKLHRRIQSPNLLQWTKHLLEAVSKLIPTKEEVKLEEGVDDLLQEQTGENDPYDMPIAPIFIYENQVLPIRIHNLSKSFRPNLATIRVLSFGTIFIPKCVQIFQQFYQKNE